MTKRQNKNLLSGSVCTRTPAGWDPWHGSNQCVQRPEALNQSKQHLKVQAQDLPLRPMRYALSKCALEHKQTWDLDSEKFLAKMGLPRLWIEA